ncbi:GNAT family N-acetyltransferase [Luteibaculum oceani]|uniref:GNAT family N-acetyltransferase n=1 Tax=Luteibaculum oceani TaxID=1294296 RepID=A0A5C6VAF4_9FLAO|nr:GNAT family N-acetyltransferase [Luteibaculum oceani]TXC81830.1 GNAT family N-acetyltransferase [Luteibaculum oceani]
MSEEIRIRPAKVEDMDQVLGLIKELALYENAPQEVAIDTTTLKNDGFSTNNWFSCIVACEQENIVGFALFYKKYSTWKGKALYLEDLCVSEPYRRKGIGAMLFESVVKTASDWNCQRMEWQVLDWNEPAINFYKKYQADLDPEWINGKLFPKDFTRILNGGI